MTDPHTLMATYIWVGVYSLHVDPSEVLWTGHALNKVVKDIINRFHLLQGRRIQYASFRAVETLNTLN